MLGCSGGGDGEEVDEDFAAGDRRSAITVCHGLCLSRRHRRRERQLDRPGGRLPDADRPCPLVRAGASEGMTAASDTTKAG